MKIRPVGPALTGTGAHLVSDATLSRAKPVPEDGAPASPGGGFGSEPDPAAPRRFYVQDRFQGNGEVPSSKPVRPFRYAVKI